MLKSVPGPDPNKEVSKFISTVSYFKQAGDNAVNNKNYDTAILNYTNALKYIEKFTRNYNNEVRIGSIIYFVLSFVY